MGLLGLIRQKLRDRPVYEIRAGDQEFMSLYSYKFEIDDMYKLARGYNTLVQHAGIVKDVKAPKIFVYSSASKSKMTGMLKKAESRIREEIGFSTETIAELERKNITDMPNLSGDMSYHEQLRRENVKQVGALYGIWLIEESLDDGRVLFANEQNLNIEKSKFV